MKTKRFISLRYIIFLFACIQILSACAVKNRQAMFTSPTDLVTDTLKNVYVVNDKQQDSYYKIKPNDLLAIRNLQNIEFGAVQSGSNNITAQAPISFLVENDGTVALPVIGKVTVVSLNRYEAKDKIQAQYKQSLLKDPIIELSIVNLKITMLGDFAKQGNFFLQKENTSLVEMIGEAGGINPKADPKTLKIIRGDRKNPEIIYVNLQNVNSLSSPKLNLQNDDIVYIQPTKFSNVSQRIQDVLIIAQPVLLILNTGLIIYNLTK